MQAPSKPGDIFPVAPQARKKTGFRPKGCQGRILMASENHPRRKERRGWLFFQRVVRQSLQSRCRLHQAFYRTNSSVTYG